MPKALAPVLQLAARLGRNHNQQLTATNTPEHAPMNHTSKADKIRAIIAEKPEAKAKEIVEALAAKKVKVTLPQVYSLLQKANKPKRGRPAKGKASGYDSLIQAKKLADAMGGVEKAKAALDVLAKLV
jgi:3-methyladenine DNA glycosylase AlkC